MRPILVSVLILFAGLGWLAGCVSHRNGEQRPQALQPPTAPPKRPGGMAALTVKPGGALPFDQKDVATYFQTHNLPRNLTSTSDFQLETLEFLTNKEVSQRLQGASPGLADQERVGFATLRGLFVFTGPPPAKPARFSRAYAVFDTTTGNLLMLGTLEPERPR